MSSNEQKQTLFANFKEQQQELLRLLQTVQSAFQKMQMKTRLETIETLTQKVRSDTFKVMVVGEFKRGKSTLINALLSEEILPAFCTPTTAVINEIKWGENKKAILHFLDPLPESLPEGLSPKALEHIRKNKGKAIPPMEIPVNEIEDYVVIADPAADPKDSVAQTPYEKVELFWPISFCKDGVEIIDSPGLNEHRTRSQVTTNYLLKVDAVVFVMNCSNLGSESEMDVIEKNIRSCGYEEIFFIANRFDEIRSPKEKERMMDYAKKKLGKLTKLEPGLYFLSALNALDGKIENNEEKIQESRILLFERALEKFLVVERGTIKLLQPAKNIRHTIRQTREEMPEQRKKLETSLAELEAKYQKSQKDLQDVENKRDSILHKIKTHRLELKEEIRRKYARFLQDISNKIPSFEQEYNPESQIGVLQVIRKDEAAINAFAKKVIEHLTKKVESAALQWKDEVMQPLYEKWLDRLQREIKNPLENLIVSLDQIRYSFSGCDPALQEQKISAMERILCSAVGWLLISPGSALVGGTMGFNEMLKSVVPNIGVILAMVLLGVTNPWLLIAGALGTGACQIFFKAGAAQDEIKKKIAEKFQSDLKEKIEDYAEEAADAVFDNTERIEMAIEEGINKEIQSIRDNFEAVIRDKKKGESEVNKQKGEIQHLEQQLNEIDSGLDKLIFDIAGNKNTKS